MKKFCSKIDLNKIIVYKIKSAYIPSLIFFGTIAITGCASNHTPSLSKTAKTQNLYTSAPPPPSLNQNTPATQISQKSTSGNNGQNKNSSNSNNSSSSNNNNQYSKNFQRIEEQRGYGGNIVEVRVNNRGDIPPYYLNPQQYQYYNTNAPDKLMTPSWKISW